MNIEIHRGTHQIGGTCIELTSGKTRILLDLGMPLNDKDGNDFPRDPLKDQSIGDLKKSHILPKINGLYEDEESDFDAIFISHSHGDHYGLVHLSHPNIPIYMSPGAKRMIETLNMFLPRKINIERIQDAIHNKDIEIGNFIIKPYLMDHSAFDARGFFVTNKITGKTLFYSGDFRSGGHKENAFKMLINNPPINPDYLIMEGTTLGRPEAKFKTEKEAQKEIGKVLKENKPLVFVACSGQNIDRICSFYAEAQRHGYTFVIDPYIACVLENLKSLPYASKIPLPSMVGIKTLIHNYNGRGDKYAYKIGKSKEFKYILKIIGGKNKIRPEEIKNGKYLILIRDGIVPALKAIPEMETAALIYSQWKGYLGKDKMKLTSFIKESGLDKDIRHIHASGHADFKTLKSLVSALKPKAIIPVHTEHPKEFKKLHENIIFLKDNEDFDL